jgi:hypothetical protein
MAADRLPASGRAQLGLSSQIELVFRFLYFAEAMVAIMAMTVCPIAWQMGMTSV